MKERAAVSGSHGFIGEALVSKLKETHDVYRLSRGEEFINAKKIFDLAAFGNISHQKDPRAIYQANVLRLVSLLESTKAQDYDCFVVTSSLAVNLPVKTFYSESKIAAEKVAQKYAEEYDKPIVIIRPASVYGPYDYSGHLIPKIIKSCRTGEKMPFVPHPHHDFIFIDDFIDAVLKVSDNAKDCRGHVFEIGTGISYSNKEILETIESLMGKQANIEYVDSMRSFDTDRWIANTWDIRALGWEPKYTLKEGLRRTIYES